jgi:murein DD-endopeptidase MepM/ murein hydrolase activator NlpD
MKNNFPFTGIFALLAALVFTVPLSAMDNKNINVQIIPKKITQGDAILLMLSCPDPTQSILGEWRGKTFSFYREKNRAVFSSLIGIDLEEIPGKKTIILNIHGVKGNSSQMPVNFTVSKKDFPVQRLTLPSNMVFLSPDSLARVKREKASVDRLWDLPAVEKKWKKTFIMPVRGTVLSPFGVRRFINNAPRSPHTGIDLRAKAGTPVLASSDGIVAMISELFFAGKAVFLDHGMGIITMYFHLSEVHVKESEKVAQGQILGRVGQTGRASGPHLHWGVRIHGNRIDPLSLVHVFKNE